MSECLVWIFGRGASAACGLTWTVPEGWSELERDTQVMRITEAIKREMDSEYIDTSPYRNLLDALARRTKDDWHNRFVTTNWDYLLQREVEWLGLEVVPQWLSETHVYHLNGTVEELEDNSNRSPFLLEADAASDREQSIEANVAFNHLMWQRMFVVVGMSFSCEMDQGFLGAISHVEDDLPIGESTWVVVNRNEEEMNHVGGYLQDAMPHAEVRTVHSDFGSWIMGPMTELVELGALNAH
jgi:hypothetical protein